MKDEFVNLYCINVSIIGHYLTNSRKYILISDCFHQRGLFYVII